MLSYNVEGPKVLVLVASLLLVLVAMPGAPSSFLLLVVRPGAPSSVYKFYVSETQLQGKTSPAKKITE